MRTVIYISGITAAGKTTAAKKLSAHLGIPLVIIDEAFNRIANKYGYLRADKLVWPKNLSEFSGSDVAKEESFRMMIPPSGDFIVEGFSLGFKGDRELLEKIIGPHKAVRFHLNPKEKQWNPLAKSKGYEPPKEMYAEWQRSFEPPESYYEIPSCEWLLVHHEPYQRPGLTDIKWNQLKMPESISGSVLDLGCNAGWIGKYCRERGAAKVVGVDNNWRYLEDAKDNGYQTVLSRLEDFDTEEKFDNVFCLAVFHYLKDKPEFIRKLAKWTAGECVVEVPLSNLDGFAMERYYGEVMIPTMNLMMEWLTNNFKVVKVVGRSISPDGNNSTRWIFKCSPALKD